MTEDKLPEISRWTASLQRPTPQTASKTCENSKYSPKVNFVEGILGDNLEPSQVFESIWRINHWRDIFRNSYLNTFSSVVNPPSGFKNMRELQISPMDTLKNKCRIYKFPLSCVAQRAMFSAWTFLGIYEPVSSGHFPQGLREVATTVGWRSCIPWETFLPSQHSHNSHFDMFEKRVYE